MTDNNGEPGIWFLFILIFQFFFFLFKEYLIHAPCMRIVQTGYEQCAVEYQSHVREHNGGNGGGNNALGSGGSDDPLENSKKLCWYVWKQFNTRSFSLSIR